MDATATIYRFLPYAEIVGFAAVLVRLSTSQLIKTYRFFAAYALFQALRITISMMIPYRSNMFAEFFFICEPVVWILSCLALLEVYGIVLKNHPGIATLGRKALTGSIGASIVLALCTLFLDYQNAAVKYPILANFLLLSRLVMVSLLLFVVFIAFFLVWFPIPLNRNTVLHSCVFAGYFLIKSTTFLVIGLLPEAATPHVNAAIHLLITLCCVCWTLGLSPGGEHIPAKIGHYWNREDEERLMAQLDSINRTLVHSAKD
jgi:hypothetical protein